MSCALPWKLTGREQQVLTLWIKLGRLKAVARELGLTDRTVSSLVSRAVQKIKPTGTSVQALLEFDRALRKVE